MRFSCVYFFSRIIVSPCGPLFGKVPDKLRGGQGLAIFHFIAGIMSNLIGKNPFTVNKSSLAVLKPRDQADRLTDVAVDIFPSLQSRVTAGAMNESADISLPSCKGGVEGFVNFVAIRGLAVGGGVGGAVFHVVVCVFSGAFCPRFAHPCRGEKRKARKKEKKRKEKESPAISMRGKPALTQAPHLVSHAKGKESR